MKITVEQEKPVFKPITITLETAQEYFELLAVLGEIPSSTVKCGMEALGLGYSSDCNRQLAHSNLYWQLKEYFNQVKETL